MRNRSARTYSSPAKSSKSQPFAIVSTGPRGWREAGLVRDRVRRSDDRIRPLRDEGATPRAARSFIRTSRPLRSAVRMRPERVAEVGHPLRARRRASPPPRRGGPSPGGDVVRTTSMPSRSRAMEIALGIAVRVPRHVLVGDEQPPADGLDARRTARLDARASRAARRPGRRPRGPT